MKLNYTPTLQDLSIRRGRDMIRRGLLDRPARYRRAPIDQLAQYAKKIGYTDFAARYQELIHDLYKARRFHLKTLKIRPQNAHLTQNEVYLMTYTAKTWQHVFNVLGWNLPPDSGYAVRTIVYVSGRFWLSNDLWNDPAYAIRHAGRGNEFIQVITPDERIRQIAAIIPDVNKLYDGENIRVKDWIDQDCIIVK